MRLLACFPILPTFLLQFLRCPWWWLHFLPGSSADSRGNAANGFDVVDDSVMRMFMFIRSESPLLNKEIVGHVCCYHAAMLLLMINGHDTANICI